MGCMDGLYAETVIELYRKQQQRARNRRLREELRTHTSEELFAALRALEGLKPRAKRGILCEND